MVHSKGGFLDNAIKRLRQSKKEKHTGQACPDKQSVDEAVNAMENVDLKDVASAPKSQSHPSELVRALKAIVANKQNIDEIKAKLRATMDYRSEMMKNEEVDLCIEFPYFFMSPDLVLSRFPELLISSNFAYEFSVS